MSPPPMPMPVSPPSRRHAAGGDRVEEPADPLPHLAVRVACVCGPSPPLPARLAREDGTGTTQSYGCACLHMHTQGGPRGSVDSLRSDDSSTVQPGGRQLQRNGSASAMRTPSDPSQSDDRPTPAPSRAAGTEAPTTPQQAGHAKPACRPAHTPPRDSRGTGSSPVTAAATSVDEAPNNGSTGDVTPTSRPRAASSFGDKIKVSVCLCACVP